MIDASNHYTAQMLDHEARLRVMESKYIAHEAVCAERYNNLDKKLAGIDGSIRQHMRYLLMTVIFIALSAVLGPENVAQAVREYFKS